MHFVTYAKEEVYVVHNTSMLIATIFKENWLKWE